MTLRTSRDSVVGSRSLFGAARLVGAGLALALIAGAGLSACSADPERTSPGSSGGNPGTSPSGGVTASGGTPSGGASQGGGVTAGTGGQATASGGAGQGGAGAGAASGGAAPSGGSAGAPTGGAGGTANGGQSGEGPGGTGGALGGSGGDTTSSGGGTAGLAGGGAGGETPGGAAGDAGMAGDGGGAGGGAGGGGAGAPSQDIECPQGATFCTGFEDAALPEGTQWHLVGAPVDNAYRFDTAQKAAGNQSLHITATGSGGFLYRALAMPVPGNDFWVRLHMRLGTALGDNSHDSVFGASSGNLAADVNGEALIELSEQFEQVLLNTDDQLFTPMTKSKLAADTWHCIEAHYDGGSGTVEIFVDGEELINAPGYKTLTLQSFRVGYMRYNDDRDVWFDDVIIGPSRVACP